MNLPEPQPGECLEPTRYLDSTSTAVVEFARAAIGDAVTDAEKSSRLYYAVRDGVWYSPYVVSSEPGDYRASTILGLPEAFCVQKAILLTAVARAAGIPSRLRFADVRNHLASEKLRALMRTDIFAFHGYSEVYVCGRWLKATPTFNRQLCERFGVLPLDFDGMSDAVFHPFDGQNRRHMEYVRDRGAFADFPFAEMVRVLCEAYPGMYDKVFAAPDDPAFRVG